MSREKIKEWFWVFFAAAMFYSATVLLTQRFVVQLVN
jgi:hypothetical protein